MAVFLEPWHSVQAVQQLTLRVAQCRPQPPAPEQSPSGQLLSANSGFINRATSAPAKHQNGGPSEDDPTPALLDVAQSVAQLLTRTSEAPESQVHSAFEIGWHAVSLQGHKRLVTLSMPNAQL